MIKKFTLLNKIHKNLILTFLKLKLFDWVNQKFIFAGIYFFIFLFVGFFYLTINRASALDVIYPPIPGSTQIITAETKLPDFVKYLFDAGMFFGFSAVFISLTIAGIMYFLSPVKSDLLADAKDRVSGAISGLLILVLTYLIITTLNPQLSFLKLNEPPPLEHPPAVTKAEGVYFYKPTECSDNSVQPKTLSVPDLELLTNQVNSVGIIQNLSTQTYYFTILYDHPELWGKCQYITTTDPDNPDQTCRNVGPFASSASIYQYNFNPNGDGVYFYRKSCFNNQFTNDINNIIAQCNENSGGYYKVENSEIKDKGVYASRLGDLQFLDVPEEEQDCTGYDKNGECVNRTIPSLDGENISSIIINGDYLVLFAYLTYEDDPIYGPYTNCQEFPTSDDVNKMGPQQIKWENIRNSNGVIPNNVIIFPIKR